MTKLLLVEDSEQIWDFLSRRLQRRGFDVSMAHDGESGVKAAQSVRPDVILLDMNLPILDGWTVARTLRLSDATRAIPIIALTAHAMSGDREKTIQAGCNDYHPKPIDFARLVEQIHALLPGTKV
jgi:two-component system, cell cycle response regulator DivK